MSVGVSECMYVGSTHRDHYNAPWNVKTTLHVSVR